MKHFAEHLNIQYKKQEVLNYISFEELFERLVHMITSNNGEIFLRHEVTELIIETGKVIGVKIKDRLEFFDHIILNLPLNSIQNLSHFEPFKEELFHYSGQPPQFIYVYDILLNKRIRSDITNLLDIDNGVYLNDFGLNMPSSAPNGKQMINGLRFLSVMEQENDNIAEKSKEIIEDVLNHYYFHSFYIFMKGVYYRNSRNEMESICTSL